MNSIIRQQLLDEACQIGNSLIQQAEWEQNLVWKTLRANKEKKILWQYSENLYDGVAGIALFLIELSRYSPNSQYAKVAENSFQKLIEYCRQNPISRYGFYSGRMGVAYVAYRFFEITNNQEYLAAAFELARNAIDFLTSYPPNEIFSGTSGTLLGLLHLHLASDKYDKSQLPWIESTINEYIAHIINNARVWRQGLYWDRSSEQIKGLCGFTHGASGIGFVMLETARYFHTKPLEYIAEQAFFYESLHYKETHTNWADLRKRLLKDGEIDTEHEVHFINQQREYFNHGGDINAWCNGAVGIGLSRLRAFEILGDSCYKDEVQSAILKTIETTIETISPRQSFALCHAAGGNADLFISAATLLGNEQLLEYAEIIGRNALQVKQYSLPYRSCFGPAEVVEDRSLFVGNAGIGYFLLRLFDSKNVPSITAPIIYHTPSIISKLPNFTLSQLREQCISKQYLRTITLLKMIAPDALEAYFTSTLGNNRLNEQTEFCNFLQVQVLPVLEHKHRLQVEEVFTLENAKVIMENSIESNFYLLIKQIVNTKRLQEINRENDDFFLQNLITIDPNIQLLNTYFQWKINEGGSQELSLLNLSSNYLLKATPMGIVEIIVSDFTATIINSFSAYPITVKEGITKTLRYFDFSSREEEMKINSSIISQIMELIKAEILSVS